MSIYRVKGLNWDIRVVQVIWNVMKLNGTRRILANAHGVNWLGEDVIMQAHKKTQTPQVGGCFTKKYVWMYIYIYIYIYNYSTLHYSKQHYMLL
jgi:hypothetical protein